MLYSNYLQDKYHNAIKFSNSEGVPCILKHSKGKYLKDYNIYGNSIQKTRSGKNLIDYTQVIIRSGTSVTFIQNGFTYTGDDYFYFDASKLEFGTYVMSWNYQSDDALTPIWKIMYSDDTYSDAIHNGESFELTQTAKRILIYPEISNTVYTTTFTNIQLEKGSTVTSYEEYGASPSSDFVGNETNVNVLEYIKSTGTQYIDTGVIPKKTTKMIVEFMGESEGFNLSSKRASIAGSYDSNDNSFAFNFGAGEGRPHADDFFFWVDKTYDVGATIYKFTGVALDVKHKVTVQSGSATIDSTTKTIATKTADHVGTPMVLFGNNRSGDVWCNTRMPLRIYSCKIYEGNTLVRDYIPAEKNNVIGMYDKVTHMLYTNSGTGDFIHGDIIDKIYDIPITVSGKNLFDESNDIVRKNTGDTGKLVIGGYNVHLIKNYYHSGNSIPTYTDSTTGTDGTNIFTIGVNLKAGGTYTASAKFLSDSGNKGQSISLVWRYTDGTVYGGWGTNQFFAYGNTLSATPQIGKVSFTPEKDIDILQIQYFTYGKYVYMVKDTLQIEESSERTAYEPYRTPYQYNIKLQHPLRLYDYLDNTGIAVHYDGEPSPNLFKFEYMNDNRSGGVHFYNEKFDTDLLQPGTYYFKIGKIVTLKGLETMTDSEGNTVNVADSDTSSIQGRYVMRLYDENKKLVKQPIANGWLKAGLGNTFGACYDMVTSDGTYYHTVRSGDTALETVTIIILLKPAYLQLGYADGSASQTGNKYTNMSKSKSLHPILTKGPLPSEYSTYNRSEESFAAPVIQTSKGTNIITVETDVKPSNIKVKYIRL